MRPIDLHRLYHIVADKRHDIDQDDDIALVLAPGMAADDVAHELDLACRYILQDTAHMAHGVVGLDFEDDDGDVNRIFLLPSDYPASQRDDWHFEWLCLPSHLNTMETLAWSQAVSCTGFAEMAVYASGLAQVAEAWSPASAMLPAIRISDEQQRTSVLHDGYCPTCYTTWQIGMGSTVHDWLVRCPACMTPADVPYGVEIQRQPATPEQQHEVDTLRRLVERAGLDFPDLSGFPGSQA